MIRPPLELCERSLGLCDGGVNLFGKLAVVGGCQPDLWVSQIGRASHLAGHAVRALPLPGLTVG